MAFGTSFRSSLWRVGKAGGRLRGGRCQQGAPRELEAQEIPEGGWGTHLVTPMCRETVSQVLPAERGTGEPGQAGGC